MGRVLICVLSVGYVLGCADPCLGHGAHCVPVEGAIAVEAAYHDGSPMAFCDVEVFRPGGEGEAFQVGTTDSRGRYAFVPDTAGTWTVAVDDGMGHRAEADVAGGSESAGRPAPGGGIGPLGGTVIGVSVIFGLFGLLSLLYRRPRRQGQPCT